MKLLAVVKKKERNASGHQDKMSARDKKPTGTLDFSRSPCQFFFPRLVIPFYRTFHICLARNLPVEKSSGDVMTTDQ